MKKKEITVHSQTSVYVKNGGIMNIENFPRKIVYLDRSEIYIDKGHRWKLRSGNDYHDLKESIDRNGILEPLIVAKDGKILSGRNRYLITEELRKQNPERFKLLYCWQFTKELPPEKEVEIVNHLKTLAPRVKDSDIDRLLSVDFADLMKQKFSGGPPGKERFNRAKYIAERIGRSEGYIKNRISLFQKKQKLKKYSSGELEIRIDRLDEVKALLRKYRKINSEYLKISDELNAVKAQIAEITDFPVSSLVEWQAKGRI